jgi:hypothetical protein
MKISNVTLGWRATTLGLAFVLVLASNAVAATAYTGTIGRIDTRTGHADTSVYRFPVVLREPSGAIICVIETASAEFAQAFLSQATAAMIGNLSVTIERGGSASGQYKCHQIQVTR